MHIIQKQTNYSLVLTILGVIMQGVGRFLEGEGSGN